ncbi:MAG: hypothetical protein FH749_00750 [Firmicutes bacterium]|nr:hypothetical protein [Bacillota bacterium]
MVNINELNILGFGRFHQRRYQFSSGLNLIYGGNEAGKSTLHRFIEAMLFGFWQPGVGRKECEALWLRFQPWQQQAFAGELTYTCEQGTILVRRDFASNTVSVFDAASGEPVNGLPENIWGEPDFAGQHLGCSKLVFRNTISISQLGTVADVETAAEIRELLRNLAQSGGSGISVQQGLLRLEAERNQLGSEDGGRKTLAGARSHWQQLVDQLEHNRKLAFEAQQLETELAGLSAELKTLEKKRLEYKELLAQWRSQAAAKKLAQIEELRSKQRELEAELAGINAVELPADACQIQERLSRDLEAARNKLTAQMRDAEDARERLQTIRAKIDSLSAYEQYSHDTLIELASAYQLLAQGRQVMEEQQQQLEDINSQLREVTTALSQLPYFRPDTLEHAGSLEAKAQGSVLHGSQEDLEDQLDWSESRMGLYGVLRVLCWLMVPAVGASAWFLEIYPLFALAAPFIFAAIALGGASNRLAQRCRNLRREIYALEMEFQNSVRQREQAQQELNNLLARAQVDNLDQLETKFRRFLELNDRSRELHREHKFISGKLENYQEEIDQKDGHLKSLLAQAGLDQLPLDDALKLFRMKIDELAELRTLLEGAEQREKQETEAVDKCEQAVRDLERQLDTFYQQYSISSPEELEQLSASNHRHAELKGHLEQLRQRIQDLLGDQSPEHLAQTAATADPDAPASLMSDKTDELEALEAELNKLQQRRGEISGRLEGIYGTLQSVAELEEAVEQARTNYRQLQTRRQALDLAIETIEGQAANLGTKMGPGLNEKVAQLVERITGGKYRELNIAEGLKITVRTPEHSEPVDLEKLSGGTIDQVYFASRVAIADLVTENSQLPLFLDDSFVQYDDIRLKNMLSLLLELARERQILLFTCQKREVDMLEQMAPDRFNYLNLEN